MVRFKSYALASLVALLAGTGVAMAQAVEGPTIAPPTVDISISPTLYNAFTQGGKIKSGGVKVTKSATGEITANAIAPAFTLGWNVVHINNCLVLYSNGYYWMFAYADNSSVYYTAVPAVQTAMAPQCSSGNYSAFLVVNTTGGWTQFYTWNFK